MEAQVDKTVKTAEIITTTRSIDQTTTKVRFNSITYLLVTEKCYNSLLVSAYELQEREMQRKRNAKHLSETNDLFISLVLLCDVFPPLWK